MGFPPARELGGEAFPTARWEPPRDPPQRHGRFPARPRRQIPIGRRDHPVKVMAHKLPPSPNQVRIQVCPLNGRRPPGNVLAPFALARYPRSAADADRHTAAVSKAMKRKTLTIPGQP
jgi:hypothetical protein